MNEAKKVKIPETINPEHMTRDQLYSAFTEMLSRHDVVMHLANILLTCPPKQFREFIDQVLPIAEKFSNEEKQEG